ncbi:MAG: P13 family porin [Spirochaetaceae bacterium]|jgi:TolB-like protein|nr:P13 family porin [Spirochaetaceae bacterium]
MAKKNVLWFGLLVLLFVFGVFSLNAQTAMSLNESIDKARQDIENKLPERTKIVVLNFTAPSERFSNYVLEELTARLVNSGKLTVVDRQNLDLIQQEMNFQYSGEVSDGSMQSIGQKLGAQSIVSGSLAEVGGEYRLRFRTISVETAAIEVLTNATVRNDKQISGLFTSESNIGLTWTSSEKWTKGAMNMAFGLGSFTMKDWAGGSIVAGAELVGVILLGVGLSSSSYEEGADGSYSSTSGNAGAFLGGLALTAGSLIYGYVRPFSYDKSLAAKNGLAFNPGNINIALGPNKGGMAVQMSYKMSF